VARLEPTVRDEVERLARALCRRPEIIATCGHALLVVRRSDCSPAARCSVLH
jgi:hypothetical protein